MELTQRTHASSKFAPEGLDLISNMPDNVVTNILDRLPIKYAVRTSILARNWRFKWNMLSQVLLDEAEFLLKTNGEDDFVRIISRLLFSLKGAITKFALYINTEENCYDKDIAHWILFLSRKGVTDLTIGTRNGRPLKLPSHLFSCLKLKRLELYNCSLLKPSSFHGFPDLLSLKLCFVSMLSGKFGEFFTQSPLLEILNLRDIQCRVKLVEIAKLTNLKILTLRLLYTMMTSSSSIIELVGFLPKLQELHLEFIWGCEFFAEENAPRGFQTTYYCLKTLQLSDIDLEDDIMLSLAFKLIRSSPNLQTLEIKAGYHYGVVPTGEVDYSTIEMLQLESVVFEDLKGTKNELCLIKYLLGCSPFLKKIDIHPDSILKSEEKLIFAMKLLTLHRASPVAEINLNEF